MSAKTEKLTAEKGAIVKGSLEKDRKLFDLAFDAVLNQLEGEGCLESGGGHGVN